MKIEKIINEFAQLVERKRLGVEGIAVADEKRVIVEHRFTADLPRNIYSHTKSYTSTAVGIAVDEGKLSLTDKLADFFPEYVPENPQPWLLEITLRDLLTMSSGFGWMALSGDDDRKGVGAPNYDAYMMSQKVRFRPGTRFVYSNGDTQMALRMAEKVMEMPFGEYIYRRMFEPMGMGWPIWEHDPQGHAFGASGMFLTLKEMLKIGQLYLMDGKWNGERIISPEWVAQASAKQIDTLDGYGYGYQFWMDPFPGCYRADGAYGQQTHIFPACGLVVGIQCPETGNTDEVMSVLYNETLPAIMESAK